MSQLDEKVIKGYQLLEPIGYGGFGAVYRAHQAIVEREVAVKVILPEHASRPEFIRRFDAEAQLVGRLEHPYIVPLYDYWRDPDGAYLVMRLLRGGNLHDDIVQNGAWSVLDAARFLDQITAALATAHQAGVVHQDLKPGNIMLDEKRNAYLVDFGIARNFRIPQVEDDDGIPRMGTPMFMAPEQFSKNLQLTPQTDTYSLGLVLYTILAGQMPFTDLDTKEIIRHQVQEPLPPLQFVRPDLPHEINFVIMRATSKIPEVRYPDATMMAEDFHEQIAGFMSSQQVIPSPGQLAADSGTVELSSGPSTIDFADTNDTAILDEPALIVQNPYKGLRAFREADAADFFGREALTKQLLQQITQSNERFLAVVGPSGSGKSSVVMAGVLPLLRQGYLSEAANWFISKMHPGPNPLDALEAALLQIALERPPTLPELLRDETRLTEALNLILPGQDTELLLVIDQFEEVFTLVKEEKDRVHFLNLLQQAISAPDRRLRIIITLRADFYDRPLSYAGFGNLLKDNTAIILPLSDQELTKAITQPGRRANLTLEPALINALLVDVREQPGTLPLLQYTLTQLFEQREDDTLTAEAYHNSGGLTGILSTQADNRYQQLNPTQQGDARQIFLRLVAINEQAETTRQRVKLADLYSIGGGQHRDRIQSVLDVFGQDRLLTFDYDPQNREPTVEIAHEALIREWGRLQDWLAQNRSDLLTQRRLSAAIHEWQTHNHDSSYLATGSRLAAFESWQNNTSITLNADEQRYIAASIKLHQQGIRRRQFFIAALAIIALIAGIAAIFAFYQQAQARQQTRIARSRELAATARNELDQLDLTLLLSLEALKVHDTYEAQNSLLMGLQSEPYLLTFLPGQPGPVRAVAYAPDGSSVAAAGEKNIITLWNPDTGQIIASWPTQHTDWINHLAFSPDGQTLAAAGEDGRISLWNPTTREAIPTTLPDSDYPLGDITFNPAGDQLIAVGNNGTIIRWDTTTDSLINAPDILPTDGSLPNIETVAFSPDGRLLALGGDDQNIHLWDVETETLVTTLTAHTNTVQAVDFSPDGTLLVSGDYGGKVIVWDLRTGQSLGELPSLHNGEIWRVRFSPDGTLLAVGSTDNDIRLWDMATGTQARPTFKAHNDQVRDLAFSPDGSRLVSGSIDTQVVLWSIVPQERLSLSTPLTLPPAAAIAYAPGQERIATANGLISNTSEDNTIQLWNLEQQPDTALTAEAAQTLTGHEDVVTTLAFSPNGEQLISGSINQDVYLWELAEPPTYRLLSGHITGILSAAFHPNRALAATGDDTGTIYLWDTTNGRAIEPPLQHGTTSVIALTFSPNSDLLATGSRDGSITLWNSTSHAIRHTLPGHDEGILALVFSPDGQTLASVGRDDLVRLWDVSTGQALGQPLAEHINWITAVAFSPDGRLLATGSQNGRLILWHVDSRRMLGGPFELGDHWITNLTFTDDGETLLVATDEMTITAWSVALAAWQDQACAIVGRNLTPDEQGLYLNSTTPNTCVK